MCRFEVHPGSTRYRGDITTLVSGKCTRNYLIKQPYVVTLDTQMDAHNRPYEKIIVDEGSLGSEPSQGILGCLPFRG